MKESLSFCLKHVNFRLWSNTFVAKQKNQNTLSKSAFTWIKFRVDLISCSGEFKCEIH